jgi:CheY-like chemotaxis protein
MIDDSPSFLNKSLPDNRDMAEIERLTSMGELVAGIAHELTNPLTAILGYSEILKSLDIDPQIKRYISNIHIAAMRSVKIMEGLLTFLRKKEVELSVINVNDVIKQTVSLFEYQMRTNSISLIMNLSSSIPFVKGDFYKLQQVFFNIIMNALQSLETWYKDRRVSISTEFQNDIVRIIIADSGPGIDSDCITKIFLPFYTTKPKGTGLGLSIAYGIIKEHGGEISVCSKGYGCSFIVELPPADYEHHGFTEVKKSDFIRKINKKILIVDDDELVIDALGSILELMGCDVVFTTVASDGMSELKKRDFDLVFVDYKMPHMSGIDFIESASEFIDIKRFVLITGDVTLDADKIRHKYDIPVICKPISLKELKSIFSNGA